jgi:hypothetical protein
MPAPGPNIMADHLEVVLNGPCADHCIFKYLQVQTSVFFSGDLVPDLALHFWHVITNKVECVGYSPSK